MEWDRYSSSSEPICYAHRYAGRSCRRFNPGKILIMDLVDVLLILCGGGVLAYWLDSLRALEAARNAGRQTCRGEGVQFLDDTVELAGLRLHRDARGRLAFRRTYRFEFSDTGDNRREGTLVLLGGRVESISMDPFRLV